MAKNSALRAIRALTPVRTSASCARCGARRSRAEIASYRDLCEDCYSSACRARTGRQAHLKFQAARTEE